MKTIHSDTGEFYDLRDMYQEYVHILVYPDHCDQHDSATEPKEFGTTIDGIEVGYYAGTSMPGVTPNADWAGPCRIAEDAMLEYEEMYPFEEWAEERGYNIED